MAELFVNGIRVCFLFGWNNAYYGPVDHVRIGLPTIINCDSTVAYVDNVAMSTSRIGQATALTSNLNWDVVPE